MSFAFPEGFLDEWTEVDAHLGATHFDKWLHNGQDLMPCEGVVGLTCAYIDAKGHICVALEGGKSSPLESLSDLDVGVRQESAGHIVAEGSQREVF